MNIEEQKYIDSINASEDADVDFGSFKISTDLYEIAQLVDIFMHQYGLGGCRSFSEFWDMVDNEDPVKIRLLQIALNERIKRENGEDTEDYKSRHGSAKHSVKASNNTSVVDSDDTMSRFLMDMGADNKEVESAVKSQNQKIKYYDDMSDINRDSLFSPDFDFNETMNRLNKAMSHTKVFKVSSATMMEAQSGTRKSNNNKS